MVANPNDTGRDCDMEGTSKQNPPLLMEGTPKHDSPLGRAYGWFLELPVPIVLAVMWLAGVTLISVWGLALYLLLYQVWLWLEAVMGS
jgi:hypothetical protein